MSDRFGKVSDVASFAQSTYAPLFQLQAALVRSTQSDRDHESSSGGQLSSVSSLQSRPELLPVPPQAVSSAALAIAMTNLIASFPYQLSRGHCPIPAEIEQAAGLQEDDLKHAHQNQRVPEAIRDMAAVAGDQLSDFRTSWETAASPVRRGLACAFLQVVSCDASPHLP